MEEELKTKTLVFSGGFMRGFIILGIISGLEELGMIDQVDTYVGTSVGAVIGFLMSIGYQSEEIFSFVMNDLVSDVRNSLTMSILNLGSRKFFMDNSFIVNHIQSMIIKKGLNPDLSLAEHHQQTHKTVVCTSYVVDLRQENTATKFISHNEYPDIRCVDALKMSFSIPFFFNMMEVNESLYVDGGISANIPYLGSEDVESTMVIVVDPVDTSSFGHRTVLKIPIKLQSMSLMLPDDTIIDIYKISKYKTNLKLAKEKKD